LYHNMTEQSFIIDISDLRAFHGANGSHLELIKSYFPKLKLVFRGDTVKAMGNPEEIQRFSDALEIITSYYEKYHKLDQDILREILNAGAGKSKRMLEQEKDILLYNTNGAPIKARTPGQIKIVELEKKNDLLLTFGPAGTGKTYTAIALAVRALKEKRIKRIILSRPAVEAGENLGFLPGDLKEKLDPYLQPLYDALLDMIPYKRLEKMLEDQTIQIAPLAFMRGRTLSNSYAILDEAQNASVKQLKMFLTRMGENAKFIVTGDITQTDLPPNRAPGLPFALSILKDIEGIGIIRLGQQDIIRHTLVNKIVEAYEKEEDKKSKS
jgi:phosphate starvation-inducible PhoH-like protein